MNNITKSKPLYRGTQVVWYILDIIEFLLAFRFILKLLGANSAAGFTQSIYSVTYILATPFLNVFRITTVAGATFEWTTLLAMLVYYFIAVALVKLLVINKPVSTLEAEQKLDRQDSNTPSA